MFQLFWWISHKPNILMFGLQVLCAKEINKSWMGYQPRNDKVWESREIKLEETHKRPWAWMTTMETLVLNDMFSSPLSSLSKTKCLCLLSAKHNAFFLFPPKIVRRCKKVKPFNENQFKKLNYCATSSMSKLSSKVLFKYHFRYYYLPEFKVIDKSLQA